MTQTADRPAEASPWSPRESELLAVTLRLLQEHGYERLTVDAVASEARASKATVYRRWPSKAELVLAAFIEGVCQIAAPPDTGTLRGDLMYLGESICAHGVISSPAPFAPCLSKRLATLRSATPCSIDSWTSAKP